MNLEFIKKHKEIFFLILISLIFLAPFFKWQYYENHDGVAHLARAAEYERSFLDGQIIPRWAGNLNAGFGSPVFILYYPFSGYLTALVHAMGFSFEHAFLLIGGFFFTLDTVGFYLWIKRSFDNKTAFLAAAFYAVLPYRFLTLYVRAGIGEFVSFSLLPFLFYSIEFFENPKIINILTSSFIYALIVLSHNAISLLFTPIILIYSFLKGKKYLINTIFSIVLGLGLSAYFWLPALVESKYGSFLILFRNMYKDQFPSFLKLIYSPWGFGPDVNKPGGLSAQIGIPAFLVFVTSLILLFRLVQTRKKRERNQILFIALWLIVFTTGVFLSTSFSSPVWQLSDFLKKFQFPWRFIVLSSFAAASLSPYIFSRIEHRTILTVLLIGMLLYSLPFVRVKHYVTRGDSFYYSYTDSTFFHAEATPIWTAGDPTQPAKAPIEIIAGQGIISHLQKKSQLHRFDVDAKTPIEVLDNTLYFPGWRARVDGNKVPIEFQDIHHRGFITFPVPVGTHHVEVEFAESPIRMISDMISLFVAILFLFLLIFFTKARSRERRSKGNF